jgi:lipopolysaccharide/colanic/teichoic acid biosynthesis glycosyltransferase
VRPGLDCRGNVTAAASAGMSARKVFMRIRVCNSRPSPPSRSLDLLASLGVLFLAAPGMLLTVLAIKLEDGWRAPVLYRQRCVGFDGRTFNAIKFRIKRPDAYGNARITRVGAVIRKLDIDEMPQVFNVLRGDMTFFLKNSVDILVAFALAGTAAIILALVFS